MTHSMQTLQRELDRCKSVILLHRGEAHLAHLLFSTSIIWAEDAVTAYINGFIIAVNPNYFMKLPTSSRETLIASLLWKLAMLHLVRGQGKDAWLWQMASSYWVNNELHSRGYSFDGMTPWLDHRYDGQAVEEIYDDLVLREEQGTLDDPQALWGAYDDDGNYDVTDLRHPTEGKMMAGSPVPPVDPSLAQKMTTAVVKAVQYAAQAGGGYSGSTPVADMVKQFLNPKVNWEREVLPFMTAQEGWDYNWQIPSRRIRHTYLPSLAKSSQGGLDHIAFMGDSSGSITKAQLVRINSEAHFIKKRFNPELFTMLNFDDEIQMEKRMTRYDRFDEMEVIGRGGTDLWCVRNWIIKNKPKAVVVFSDLVCDPMVALEPKDMVPILWIVFNNPGAVVPHGRAIHINE
ncbi:putative metallopeptidase [Agrobacterium phage OLIVR2]|uniref:Putative metallopeptidase n=1 Tax=Agrobacterium phage OLIVR1 TaxID=2723769 RepID=A0A858MR54_9CAUD|nr:VWA-like domain-containing protein [Xanthomonas campestris]YP_010107095.1 HNH endonuclease [Agrobacterium phage OLIVR1]QIW87364.1 putative metallopeptidase [Agrobacterium phage OLIVR2]QIW87471.1 putative metallopeptidase [Agrobacterium phage OLIVR3]MCF8861643.1 hypothetical protein [Xanthomonas campestris pv. campestris]QIW87256.1 putative metallopeptidase [Agrobacterium phage OLIVR1]